MNSKLTSWEIAAVAFLFVASTAALALFSLKISYSKHLDSVFLYESLDSIRATGVPDSASVNAVPIILRLFETSPEEYCALPLTQPEEPYHIFDNHAYIALYLLAVLAYFMSPEAVFAWMNTLAHLVLLFLPYL